TTLELGTAQPSHTTSAAGTSTFEGLPPLASVRIRIEHPRGLGDALVTLPATGEMRYEVRFVPGRVLTGRVVDAVTKAPIVGARVGRGWAMRSPAITRDDGTYELPAWTGTGYDDVGFLHVLAQGYARESRVVGSAERADFELQRGYAVTGRVIGGDARPIGG